jgi:hypothetical protein
MPGNSLNGVPVGTPVEAVSPTSGQVRTKLFNTQSILEPLHRPFARVIGEAEREAYDDSPKYTHSPAAASAAGVRLRNPATPACAQALATPFPQLSSGAQMLSLILRGLPRHGQQLALNSIRKLGPERAEAQLRQARSMHPATLRLPNQMVAAALRELPLECHQVFMNILAFHLHSPWDQLSIQGALHDLIQHLAGSSCFRQTSRPVQPKHGRTTGATHHREHMRRNIGSN